MHVSAVEASPTAVGVTQAAAQVKFTLQARVYLKLREDISTGRCASKEVMTLRGIAAEFGTSPMPVREAMQRLEAENALETLPNRQIQVPPVSRERFDELTEVRKLLEGRCAATAAIRATDAELQRIAQVGARLSDTLKNEDISRLPRVDHEYHFAIYRAAHTPVVLSIVETLWLQSGPYLAAPARALQRRKSRLGGLNLSRHDEITTALMLAGDTAATQSVLLKISSKTAAWYRQIVGFDGPAAPRRFRST